LTPSRSGSPAGWQPGRLAARQAGSPAHWQSGRLADWQHGRLAARQSSGLGLANQFSGKKLLSVSFFFPRKPEKSFN